MRTPHSPRFSRILLRSLVLCSPNTAPQTVRPFTDPEKAGEELVRCFYPYRLVKGRKVMTEDEASAKISAGMKGMHVRRKKKRGTLHQMSDPDREAKILARKERIAAGQGTIEDKMKDKQ